MYPPYVITVQESSPTDDGIGGKTATWSNSGELLGYIDTVTGTDLPTGTGDNAFIENSTHVAVIPDGIGAVEVSDKHRLVCNGRIYDVTYVDDPVGIGHHHEIYLRYSGGVSND